MNDTTPQDPQKIPNSEPVNNAPVNQVQQPPPPPMPNPHPTQYQQPGQPVVVQNMSQNLNPETDRVAVSEGSKSWKQYSGFFSMIQLVVGAVLLAAIINSFVFQSYQVFGLSMADTLHEGDRLIISKISKSISNLTGDYVPTRGDIVVFKSPVSPDIQLIKRVIALPGERVTVRNGVITVFNDENPSGFNPDDKYRELLPETLTGNIETVVSEGEIFVAGDNRVPGASLDSRNELGNVPIENVVGELAIRVFPLNQASFF